MAKVRKAVIPAAGLGTRFLPATKSVPKEMLPIVDKPIILYIVEEAVRAGVEEIIIVAGRNKHGIEDFFDVSYELQDKLEKDGKTDLLEIILRIQSLATVLSIRQKQALGLGHAVLCAKPLVGNEPFAVLLGDEIMIADANAKTVTQQLAESYENTGKSTVAIMKVPNAEVVKYGIVDVKPINETTFAVQSVVEKPKVEDAPSQWALPGRYVFDAAIFDLLKNTRPGKNGEIQLTDAMTGLAQTKGLLASTFTSRRYDAGDKLGFLQANIELGLQHPEIGDGLRRYLLEYAQRL